jgi:hypothetical protein
MKDLLRRGLRFVGGRAAAPEPDADARPKPLYVITLSVSPTPLLLPRPAELPEIGGLTVFRAKRMHGTRELHLQQLGYFESKLAAEALLPQLERTWPAAVVELAATAGMGSLDDTSVAEFQVLRPAAPGEPEDEPAFMRRPAADAPASQAYAVQLLRQNVPVELRQVPRLQAFRGYTIYRVQAKRDGLQQYGLRLGFFTDPASARMLADHVRSQFPRAVVVPVSEREVGRVQGQTKPGA